MTTEVRGSLHGAGADRDHRGLAEIILPGNAQHIKQIQQALGAGDDHRADFAPSPAFQQHSNVHRRLLAPVDLGMNDPRAAGGQGFGQQFPAAFAAHDEMI